MSGASPERSGNIPPEYGESPIEIREAARRLGTHLGRPPWLSCIGVGASSIKIMLNCELSDPSRVPAEWCGHPVEVVVTGPMRLCADPTDG